MRPSTPVRIPVNASDGAGARAPGEGEKRRLFIHPDQGYGAAMGHLPPNSALIFDIEVVEANHAEEDDSQSDDDSDTDTDAPEAPDAMQP